jgi:hypothetical protein
MHLRELFHCRIFKAVLSDIDGPDTVRLAVKL